MQNSFSTQPALFITNADLEHASLRGLDDAEAVLDWAKLEHLMAGIYASKTGRPSYPLLTLLRASLLGIWYRLSDVELAVRRGTGPNTVSRPAFPQVLPP